MLNHRETANVKTDKIEVTKNNLSQFRLYANIEWIRKYSVEKINTPEDIKNL